MSYECSDEGETCQPVEGDSGTYTTQAACDANCKSPTPPPCTGNSSGLNAVSCAAWQVFAKATGIAGWTNCSGALLDPCSCKYTDPGGYSAGVTCADGDITEMYYWTT